MNPPSVEGWQGGSEWINTGTYVQRVNFASRVLNDPAKPGIRAMLEQIKETAAGDALSAAELVDACLYVVGPLEVLESTRNGLIEYASTWGTMRWGDAASAARTDEHMVDMLQLVVTTQEYQMV